MSPDLRRLPRLPVPAPDAAGVIEEFDGYFSLEPDLEGITESYCRHSQAVKQPDAKGRKPESKVGVIDSSMSQTTVKLSPS